VIKCSTLGIRHMYTTLLLIGIPSRQQGANSITFFTVITRGSRCVHTARTMQIQRVSAVSRPFTIDSVSCFASYPYPRTFSATTHRHPPQ
jgi:hypothetical protein